MINLALDGYFGEAIKDAVIDLDRWDHVYDNLIDVPIPHIIEKDSLRILTIEVLAGVNLPPQIDSNVPESDPTTGPVPHSWQAVVSRDAGQASFTYVFQFGARDLWKIGHATDLVTRLSEVNKHIPHEVLGERWCLVLQQPWPTEVNAYEMEQHLLRALRTATSVGERVVCARETLERVWNSALAKGESGGGMAAK